ncbi:MAG: PQ-loop domain-containing transporter [Thermoplasmatota archaeon]
MSDALAYLGAALLTAATIPQAVRLVRRRSATDFGWPFVAMNAGGLVFLVARSLELAEIPFVIVNLVGLTFWLGVAALKAWSAWADRTSNPTVAPTP